MEASSSFLVSCERSCTHSSRWQKYEAWCLDEDRHTWLSSDPTYIPTVLHSRLAHGLPLALSSVMRSYANFAKTNKSAIACASSRAFDFNLGNDAFIPQWLKGWKIERPPRPWHANEDWWDVGTTRFTQEDNSELGTVELGYPDTSRCLIVPPSLRPC